MAVENGKIASGELKDADKVVVDSFAALSPNDFDDTPTAGSKKLMTSGAIKEALGQASEPSDYAQVKEQVQQNTEKLNGIEAGAQVNTVTGVKGNAEQDYRIGNINLTPANIGALGNSGEQTLNGTLQAVGFKAPNAIGGYISLGCEVQDAYFTFSLDGTDFQRIDIPRISGVFALLSDIYAAVQQIAPNFTAKSYEKNELCSYNGVVYRCKSAYTATASSAKPNSDTTHWEAKKVSELFLPLTGGVMSGDLRLGADLWFGTNTSIWNNSDLYLAFSLAHGTLYLNPTVAKKGGAVVAAIQNIAEDFSQSSQYAVNDLVVYGTYLGSGKLYRCTTAHQGAWNSSDFAEATVQDVLTAIRSALALKAPLASPAFTGRPTAPNMDAQSTDGQVANKKYVDDKVAGVPLRYDMPTAVALVAANDEATLVCADRAVTNATIAAGFSTLNLTFPTAVTGKVRDFYLRIVVAAGESAPALSIPQGITIENPDGAVPEIADGETSVASTTLVWFSETAPNIFTAKAETVKAVA